MNDNPFLKGAGIALVSLTIAGHDYEAVHQSMEMSGGKLVVVQWPGLPVHSHGEQQNPPIPTGRLTYEVTGNSTAVGNVLAAGPGAFTATMYPAELSKSLRS